ncbi:MAG: hypothetical protein JXR07_06565 [Reichenbachiella sp.]
MKQDILLILEQNGYLIQESKNQILIRKKLLTGWREFLYLFIPGLSILLLTLALKEMMNSWFLLFNMSISIVLMFVPFFNYFTSAYKSLLIDFENESLLFRSAVSRAYRLFEISDINLEIVSREEGGLFYKNVSVQRYNVSIVFVNGAKEELLSLVFDEDQDESIIFNLKDYFQVLLSKKVKN